MAKPKVAAKTRASEVASNESATGEIGLSIATSARDPHIASTSPRTAGHREHDALGEEVPGNAEAAAANRQPDRNLFPPRGAAREQHVPRVHAAMSNTTPDIESSAPAAPTTSLSLCRRVPTESLASGASDSS